MVRGVPWAARDGCALAGRSNLRPSRLNKEVRAHGVLPGLAERVVRQDRYGVTAADVPPQAEGQASRLMKFALIATCLMFAVAFSTMVVLTVLASANPRLDAVLDTCRWVVAITAAAIVGLVTRGGRS